MQTAEKNAQVLHSTKYVTLKKHKISCCHTVKQLQVLAFI